MLKFVGDNRHFTIIVKSEKELLDVMNLKLSMLLNEDNMDIYSKVYKTKMYETILENIIMEELAKANVITEKNKSYIFSLLLQDEKYQYLVANLELGDQDKGLIINKTLQN